MTQINWLMADGSKITADVANGMNLMEAATFNDVPHVLGECGGSLSCATCHVYVDEAWVEKCGSAEEFESEMLEATEAERKANSRLSCQIDVSDELEGLVLHVPEP